ncbi:ribonuclease P protein component [Soonwooa sp.]|uniref:ribonuclease P protein component n=1 Tax=Soonwooa sp. TaxID=1938592 RepID=UPI00262D46B7|nr:ribonuclease P protein component [Soonwooa sp.]
MTDFRYPKSEKLKKKSDIDLLFKKGKWMSYGNARLIVLKNIPEQQRSRVGVSVSKKFFKKAVDRNRIKRLLREYYRLNKSVLEEQFGNAASVMLFWVSKTMPDNLECVTKEFNNLFNSKK